MENMLLGTVLISLSFGCLLVAFPTSSEDNTETEVFPQVLNSSTGKAYDLLVVRTFIYEVGLLTDAENDTSSTHNESDEQVELKIYSPQLASSIINLLNISIPMQTNYSGQTINNAEKLGFLNSDEGDVAHDEELPEGPPEAFGA